MTRVTSSILRTAASIARSPWSGAAALADEMRVANGDINRHLVGLFSHAVARERRAEWVSDTTDELVDLADRDGSNQELADQLVLELRDAIEIELRRKIAAQVVDGDWPDEPNCEH